MTWITTMMWSLTQSKTFWSLRRITMNRASGGDGILAELFHILKDSAVKVQHSTCLQIQKTQQWPQDWKKSVFIPIPNKDNVKKKMFKLPYNFTHFTCYQSYAENPAGQALQVFKLRISKCTIWFSTRHRNQRSNCQHSLDYGESKGI